jgi:hypothetical protein
MRAHVAEQPAVPGRFQHRLIVTATLGTRQAPLLGAAVRADGGNRSSDLLAQPRHVPQSEPDGAIGLDGAVPAGDLHVDGVEPYAAALRVLDERRRMVEPHRLIVEQRRIERRRIVHLEKRARVRQQGKAGRVRLGESVQCKGRDGRDDLLRRFAANPPTRHAVAQLRLDLGHPPFRPFEPERAPQRFGLSPAEPGRHHRHAQQLLLEQRHAKRACENRLERRMRVPDGFPAGAPVEIRMHHLPDDGAGTNDGDLDDDIVETHGFEARQRCHLRARFDLEDADRVGVLEHLVDGGIVLGEVREINRLAGAGCRVLGAGCRVLGAGCWVPGAPARALSTQHAAPST